MDPLTAVGLAASILQFVQFGGSLLSKAHQIHTSALGALPDHIDCEKVTIRLIDLAEKLKDSLKNDFGDAQPLSSAITSSRMTPHAEKLREICNDCIGVSGILLERLERLRWNETDKRRKWKSLRQALKSVWSKSDLDTIAARLLGYERELELHLCAEIRANIAEVKPQLQRLDRELKNLFVTLEENKRWTVQTLLNERGFLKSTLTNTKDEMLKATSDQWANTQETIITAIGETAARNIEESLLQSLAFPMIHHREKAIPEVHKATFQWIFQTNNAIAPFTGNFVKWLESGSGIYWMKGKAASGKSTLMKFLLDDPRTLQFLHKWSGDDHLHIARFYFWLGGSREQRTQEGLFRSLLHQSLKEHPGLIRKIFPYEWADNCSLLAQKRLPDLDWSLKSLQSAFARLCSFSSKSLKICFFIDGLDEYEGDQESLAEFFKSLSFEQHIKVCLSSRPWIVFEDAFKNYPGLRLQDLTFYDIDGYVQAELGNHTKMIQLAKKDPENARILLWEIKTKADGVFLWVSLVVRSLLQGLRNHDDIWILMKRLRELPSDLGALYKHMLKSVEPVYEEEASRVFQIYHALWLIRNSDAYIGENGSISALELELAVSATREQVETQVLSGIGEGEISRRSLRLDDLLKTRCAGLLETDIVAPSTFADEFSEFRFRPLVLVTYLHRTVRDFLVSEDVLAFQRSLSNPSFDPHTSLLMGFTTIVKRSAWRRLYKSLEVATDIGFLFAQLMEGPSSLNYPNLIEVYHQAVQNALILNEATSHDQIKTFTEYDGFRDFHRFSSRWQSEVNVDLLITAIKKHLYSYIDQKLASDISRVPSREESSLILFALCSSSPMPNIAMIRLLVKHRADPNKRRNGHSAWQHFLRNAHCHRYHTTFKSGPDLIQLMDLVQVFKCLLQNGASPYTTCVQIHEVPTAKDCVESHVQCFKAGHKVENVINDLFGCLLPKEATELLRMVELQKNWLIQEETEIRPHLDSGKRKFQHSEQDQRVVKTRRK